MSKNIIIIAVILLLVAGLGLGAWWYFNQSRPPLTNISANVNTNGVLNTNQVNMAVNYSPSESDKISCAKTNDEKNCLKSGYYFWTKSQEVKDLTEAVNKGDYNLCDKLVKVEDIDICKRGVTTKVNETSYCDTAVNKAECEYFVNVKKNTWSACKEISRLSGQQFDPEIAKISIPLFKNLGL